MNRRQFLSTTIAATLIPQWARAATHKAQLIAQAVTAQILPEGDGATQMLGFNGGMPGPELRAKKGGTLAVDLVNELDEGTSVHWHGIRLNNRMDGVPVLTQEIVDPGATFAYEFVTPDAGTFWYHSHYLSHEQVARGMMGALIVEETSPPDVDHDVTVLVSDWQMQEDGTLTDDFADMHSVAHAGYMGNFARAFLSQSEVRKGDRVRLRIINAATNRIFPISVGGADGRIVALDGMPLATPRAFKDLEIAPAQRADLIVDVSGDVTINMATRQGLYRLGDLAAVGENTARNGGDIPALPAHDVPAPATPSQNLTLTMQGGAMARRHGGDNIWAFNNVSDLPDAPFAALKRGETARITLVNDTSFPHGIHLHGHHFYEVQGNGELGDLRDTTLVDAGESRDIICVFDNPGRWMLHCHMLSHQVGGMKTWVEVA